MAAADQVFPYVTVTNLPPGDAFAATGIDEIPVFMGPCSKGTVNQPRLISAQDVGTLTSLFGTGPTVKRAARALSLVAQPIVFVRIPAASVAASISTPVTVKATLSTWTGTTSGTPLDGFDIVVNFTLGGTTGTGPISYTYSTDGGVTNSTTQNLGVATSIVVPNTGVTIALGSAKVVTTGDSIAFYTMPASSSILPLTFTGTGTSAITASGTPEDAYEVAFRVIEGGTIGTAGITYQYTLNYGAPDPTWTPETSLGTANSLLLIDGPLSTESTGVTLAFAAGDLDPGDIVTFNTTSPAYDAAGVTAGTTALKNWNGTWTWVRFVGPVSESLGATVSGIVQGWDAANLPSWGMVDVRDRGTYESIEAWSARIDAEWTPYTSIYVGYSKGMARMNEPVNGRATRFPAFDACVPRTMGLPIQVDFGEFDLGQLPPDVSIQDADQNTVEYDSNSDQTGVKMGAVALRTWPGEVGVFPAGACLPGPTGEIKRIPLRRVKCVADRVLARTLRSDILRPYRIIPAGTPNQTLAGYPALMAGRDLESADIAKINRIVTAALMAAIGPQTGRSNGVSYKVNQTPVQLGGGAIKLRGELKINGLVYVVAVEATSQFVK